MIEGATRTSTPSAVSHGLLIRYRVMAFTTATLLIVLVFVGLPLQLVAHRPQVVNVVGTMHGILYLVYLFVAFQLTRRLGVPKWQMALVLLAGTVPFCAFVAERKLTRRVAARGFGEAAPSPPRSRAKRSFGDLRRRWLSRRALLLHLEVLVVAPGCALAGWWQATRALAGNELSWIYSVEWPIFALLGLWGWWYLIHEDPEVYRARKHPATENSQGAAANGTVGLRRVGTVEAASARIAGALAGLVGLELALGLATLALVPFGRPSGWETTRGEAIYLLHGAFGLPLAIGAILLWTRTSGAGRIARLTGRIGGTGVAIAVIGGLLTVAHPARLAGASVMLIGGVIAIFGYLFPALERSPD